MKKLQLLLVSMFSVAVLTSCGGGSDNASTSSGDSTADSSSSSASTGSDYDPNRGIGKWDESNVDVSTFDAAMAAEGKQISEVKCTSCHKITDERLVGPGWAGVTEKHAPYWIMNFITDPDPMIDVDPELQEQLELCLVRMPNQNLTDDDARKILEYMREIDGAN